MRTASSTFYRATKAQPYSTKAGCLAIEIRNTGATNLVLHGQEEILPGELKTYNAPTGYYLQMTIELGVSGAGQTQFDITEIVDTTPIAVAECR